MIPPQLERFIDQLITWTAKSKIKWREGASDNAYICSHNDYTLHLNYWFDPDAERGIYTMRIVKDARDAHFTVTDNETDALTMRNFIASVSVNAAGFDDIVDDFFSE